MMTALKTEHLLSLLLCVSEQWEIIWVLQKVLLDEIQNRFHAVHFVHNIELHDNG